MWQRYREPDSQRNAPIALRVIDEFARRSSRDGNIETRRLAAFEPDACDPIVPEESGDIE